MEVKCDICQAVFRRGIEEETPGGIGWRKDNGNIVNICHKCLLKAPFNDDTYKKFIKLTEE